MSLQPEPLDSDDLEFFDDLSNLVDSDVFEGWFVPDDLSVSDE